VRLEEVSTPALLLDRQRLTANAERMRRRAEALGVRLRVHVKTLKSMEVAEIAMDAGRAIAVSTLHEARYFIERGLDDVCYAVCIAPDKLAQVAALMRRAPRLSVFVDSLEAARALGRAAADNDVRLNAWIEVDSGEHRTGVAPDSADLIAIAEHLDATPRLAFAGVATHAGQAYACRDANGAREVAEIERSSVVAAAETVRAHGIECPGVSMGSTPTALHAASLDGVTELRAGVYLAQDLFQAAVGSCSMDDLALSVLATVISRDLARNRIVIDAGGLALSKDRSTAETAHDAGYGLVVDITGTASFGPLFVSNVHQEHGEIVGAAPLPFERLKLGSKVRVLPNHACMTAAMYGGYHVVDGANTRVAARWSRTNGWD
jgi:D-serine deaminase-like pyridoxal phosphate-dependent protein